MIRGFWYESENKNPYYNLAVEEYLLYHIPENSFLLYIWQNSNTVVIGQNQNPCIQCRMEIVERDKVKIARRLSGGGAVYHDEGNLNFTFIANQDVFSKERNYNILLNTLRTMGIEAELSGRNDIVVENKKISGNAFFEDIPHCFQHGTFLVNSNLGYLNEILCVKNDKWLDKGIASNKSRTVNLQNINHKITVSTLKEQLFLAFEKEVRGCKKMNLDIGAYIEIEALQEKYCSWEWIFGKPIESDVTLYNRFSWGDITIEIKSESGIFKEVRLYTDSLNTNIFHQIEQALKGCKTFAKDIEQRFTAISGNEIEHKIINDIMELIKRSI